MTQRARPYVLFLLCFLGVVFGALNSVLSSAYLPDIIRSLAPDADEAMRGTIGAFINFSFLIGGALGGIAMGFLSDRVGRRAVLALSLVCYGVGSGAGALASSWQLLSVTRLLVGVGVGAALVVTAVMVTEAWEARTRAVMQGILSVGYPVGIIGSGLVTSSISNWRVGLALGALSALLAVPVRALIADTGRWSTNAGRAHGHTLANHKKQLWAGVLIYGTMLIGIWAAFSWLPTWVESLLDGDATSAQAERGMSVALLGGGGLLGGIASGWIANAVGIKRVQAACFVLCFALSYFLFELSGDYTTAVKVGIAVLGVLFGISQGVLNTYIPELFPAAIRSAATALCFHVGRVFTAAAVFFVGALVVWFGSYGHAIFAFSLVYLVGLVGMYITRGGTDSVEAVDGVPADTHHS